VTLRKGLLALIPLMSLNAFGCDGAWSSEEGPLSGVSLVRLLIEEETLDRVTLTTFGYLSDGSRIYLTAEHARAIDYVSSIRISPGEWDRAESYVFARGTFYLPEESSSDSDAHLAVTSVWRRAGDDTQVDCSKIARQY
jgi:hypothetical protein